VNELTPLLASRSSVEGGAPAWLAGRLYQEFREPDALSPLVVEGTVLEILGHAARRAASAGRRPPPRWLRQVTDLLHARFRENLPLDELARTAAVHPAHLARVFRRHLRCSAGEYVRQLRVEHACRALSRTDTPLAEVALNVGFSDQSHFSTVFKRHTGFTPAAFRRLFRPR
jgi:AraC-like DNA-binding protein